MKIIDVNGGLGNQMFQYAFGRSLAIHFDTDLKLDLTSFQTYELREFQLDKFNVSYSKATDKDKNKYKINLKLIKYLKYLIKRSKVLRNIKFGKTYFEKQGFAFDSNVFTSNCIYFIGYWQSFKYLENIRDILLKDFTLKYEMNDLNTNMLSLINETNSISLHIRRGDYILNSHTNNIHGTCSLDYYHKAIELTSQKVDNPVYYLFSDDIEWVKENLKNKFPTHYIDFNNDTPERDIILMSKCKHNIIANSSFSWWGAWLNNYSNKIIIAPKKWVNNNNINTVDLIPKDWKRL